MALVLLVWTAGVVTIWVVAEIVLNPGVTENDIRECIAEGFIPADECEETLEQLEADEDTVIGIGVSLVIWFVGCIVLLWTVNRPRREA